MDNNVALTPEMVKFNERLKRVEDAIALREPDQMPVVPVHDGVMQRLNGSSYADNFYDIRRSGEAVIKFYDRYPDNDAFAWVGGTSGKANELAGTSIIDWPGRPGSIVDKYCTHQVLEREFMTQDEYPELLNDFTGFMQRKYLPRVYPNLKGLASVQYAPTTVLGTNNLLVHAYSPDALEAYRILGEIAKADAEAAALTNECIFKLMENGLPPFVTGISQAPYDILGDFFRGTVGMMEDLFECEDEIKAVCDMFADQQITALQYLRVVPLPVKRVFFPLHKGMDGFMNPKQYANLYWKPLKKIVDALIDMDVTPIIYTEGKYHTRLEQLMDVPTGKVIYHFEDVDMKKAKETVGKVACITGNLPVAMMEFGKKQEVIDATKYLIDTCAPGGGYIFDFNGSLENAKEENLEAMYETLAKYK
jgi:hypothetical protein